MPCAQSRLLGHLGPGLEGFAASSEVPEDVDRAPCVCVDGCVSCRDDTTPTPSGQPSHTPASGDDGLRRNPMWAAQV